MINDQFALALYIIPLNFPIYHLFLLKGKVETNTERMQCSAQIEPRTNNMGKL